MRLQWRGFRAAYMLVRQRLRALIILIGLYHVTNLHPRVGLGWPDVGPQLLRDGKKFGGAAEKLRLEQKIPTTGTNNFFAVRENVNDPFFSSATPSSSFSHERPDNNLLYTIFQHSQWLSFRKFYPQLSSSLQRAEILEPYRIAQKQHCLPGWRAGGQTTEDVT